MTSLRYKTTRGENSGICFEEVVLQGLGAERGLYVPESIPRFELLEIEQMRHLSFPELAFSVMNKYIKDDQIPSGDLRRIIVDSFAKFRSTEVTPSIKLQNYWVLELFYGPTFAFKDVALQFLGNLFEYFLLRKRFRNKLTLVGATSGDTGSAAIYGVKGKKNIECFILFPFGKVSEIQERQMTSVTDDNIHTICIRGNFDDAQEIVKQSFSDHAFREELGLGAINSINWARILVQITYYFYSWLRVTDNRKIIKNAATDGINFVIPSGNFGNALAGYYALRMGLPIRKLVISTNKNKILHEFFHTGIYKKQQVVQTIAPSMDISVSSNLERYLFYLANESPDCLRGWMNSFEKTGELIIPINIINRATEIFTSSSAEQEEILDEIRKIFFIDNYLLCPHTATASIAVKKLELPGDSTVVLATAHPAKFEEAIALAIPPDIIPQRPIELEDLFLLPSKKVLIAAKLVEVKKYILSVSKLAQRSEIMSSVAKVGSSRETKQYILLAGIVVVSSFLIFRYWKRF